MKGDERDISRPFVSVNMDIAKIIADPELQVRVSGTDPEWVDWLAEVDKECGDITQEEHLVVFTNGREFFLASGFHRFGARQKNNRLKVWCDIYEGSKREAKLFSRTKANSKFGKSLTKQDNIRRVEEILMDDSWGTWSVETIANNCRLSKSFVYGIKKRLIEEGKITPGCEKPDDLSERQERKWRNIEAKGDIPTIVVDSEGNKQVRAVRKKKPKPEGEVPFGEPTISKDIAQEVAADPKRAHSPLDAIPGVPWLDKNGVPIPKHLNAYFVSNESISASMTEDASYLRKIPWAEWIAKSPWLADQRIDVVGPNERGRVCKEEWGVEKVAEWLMMALRNSIPSSVCPACKGRVGGCPFCRTQGVVPDFWYSTYSEEEEDGDALAASGEGDSGGGGELAEGTEKGSDSDPDWGW